jgi:hypothetical protein
MQNSIGIPGWQKLPFDHQVDSWLKVSGRHSLLHVFEDLKKYQ